MKKKKKYRGYVDSDAIFISDSLAKKIVKTPYETVQRLYRIRSNE